MQAQWADLRQPWALRRSREPRVGAKGNPPALQGRDWTNPYRLNSGPLGLRALWCNYRGLRPRLTKVVPLGLQSAWSPSNLPLAIWRKPSAARIFLKIVARPNGVSICEGVVRPFCGRSGQNRGRLWYNLSTCREEAINTPGSCFPKRLLPKRRRQVLCRFGFVKSTRSASRRQRRGRAALAERDHWSRLWRSSRRAEHHGARAAPANICSLALIKYYLTDFGLVAAS